MLEQYRQMAGYPFMGFLHEGDRIRSLQDGAQADSCPRLPLPESAEEMGDEGIVSNPEIGGVCEFERNGYDRYASPGCHLENAFAEGKEAGTVMGGPFGKNKDGMALQDSPADGIKGAGPVFGFVPLDKEDPGQSGSYTDQWPASHLGFGNRQGFDPGQQ
jgi:hypothetical protein